MQKYLVIISELLANIVISTELLTSVYDELKIIIIAISVRLFTYYFEKKLIKRLKIRKNEKL